MNQLTQRDSFPRFYLFAFMAISAACLWWIFHEGIDWADLPTQWRICAYTLRGVDIYTLRGSDKFLPEIGYIYAGFHASPWGCILQNIFYGGFMSFEAAKIYFLAVNAIVLIFTSCLLWRKIREVSPALSFPVLVISLLSLDFFVAVHSGNAGGMICAFLVMAWLLCNDHPYLSGILIAFAMVKPQDALIVCIAMLLMRKLKPLFTAAIVDISAWGVVSLMTHKGMLELVMEFLFMPAERVSRSPWAGIFTLLIDDFLPAAGMSMLAGIIFVVGLYFFLPDDMPEMFKMYPAFMVITFWCYSYTNDCYVLILPTCLCLWLMMKKHSLFWMLCGAYCAFGLAVRSITRRVFMAIVSGLSKSLGGIYARTIYEAGIIAIGIFICFELRRIYSEAKS